MEAWSQRTNTVYPSWDALVDAEASGYVAVAVITDPKGRQWPHVTGPYPSQREANNARNRARAQWKREERADFRDPAFSAAFFVRPAWKDPKIPPPVVWVLETGIYDDRTIRGVFASAEEATAAWPKGTWKQETEATWDNGADYDDAGVVYAFRLGTPGGWWDQ